jgi:hypothetical protein
MIYKFTIYSARKSLKKRDNRRYKKDGKGKRTRGFDDEDVKVQFFTK